ncbi:fatty acid desaturase [Kerstersia gyiorum]|jgi:stearoyl-CoA desaturase (delta-9 desaturase)|uniref:Stearoyl-CoA desaturase (Delta-9 desaturase) n=1 Tax=Kerstersia gyiorum TaxID=206506 RepID=A0A4V2F0K0_9BURK|nr:fatty acid desaturase [Kerstersia gyiorum]AZV93537.1 acyl-CoA desaturase [Bordetella sp. J329]MCO7640789.1 fatty acid desaturase [Pseudomonas sp. S 311-6]KAB0543336.1 acyl-CoA desaturase [Kerstersia gyiorum]MCH4271149.1 fatty acid desaturase [Kerstersia gyiorum]MCI1228416.1 fatty acid desaturase [Kerstersia gyiorum]
MDTIISFLSGGLLQASWWQILIATLVMTHITIVCVTVFLHRSQTHRGLDLHPAIAHFFRFWLWMTTGMVTKEWVAIHRKHHARCEREGDPHSPMLFGIWKVLFRGAELYRQESENQETMAKFGHGTPNDWLERNVYAKHSALGILIMLGIDLLLFGVVGLTVWAVQMAWIPFWAAGVVNGIGHYWGYRNFASPDTSTNVFPWGIIIGGEELHNNHHAHASSAKFSSQWYEFDIGWVYIRMMQAVGLAKVRKVAPKLKLESDARSVDLKTLHGVITHRYEIMARYADLLKQACSQELSRLKGANSENSAQTSRQTLKRVRNWFHLPDTNLQPEQLAQIDQAVASSESLSTLMQMRKELGRLWESSSASSEQLLHDLQAWCQRAQQSGIEGLAEFASRLRRYAA